jgi:hypothetical protein
MSRLLELNSTLPSAHLLPEAYLGLLSGVL